LFIIKDLRIDSPDLYNVCTRLAALPLPKWIWGIHEGKFIRNSAQTRSWEKAEVYRRQLEATSGPTPVQTDETFRVFDRAPAGRLRDQKKARVTIETAVDAYLRDARSRELESSTLSKLEGIFRKQFLTWCTSEGYKFLDEIDLDALLLFRDTWIDGPLAKRKKQERLIGFFWACVRRGYITENSDVWPRKDQSRSNANRLFPTSRIRQDRGRNLRLSGESRRNREHQQHPAPHHDIVDALERSSHPRCGDARKIAAPWR
jgi:hypothetical protein